MRLAVVALLALAGCSKPSAKITCADAGEGVPTRVLVVGDSWASGGRLDDALAREVAAKTGAARVCSLGFSGRTTEKIHRDLIAFRPELERQLGGKADTAVILAGVNDAVIHVGAKAYRQGVSDLRDALSPLARRVVLVSVPRVDLSKPHGSPLGRVKHFLLRHLNDGGRKDVTLPYRAAAPTLPTIDFDSFVPSYSGNEQRYAADGLHLTRAEFANLGAFIGRNVR